MRFKMTCLGLSFLMFCMVGCSSPEEKKIKFLEKAKANYEQGDYVKAGLQLKNAIQIDPKFVEAYYWLGMVEEKKGNIKNAFGLFNKVISLEPENLKAHLELGKIFLVINQLEKAMEKAALVLQSEPANQEALILKCSILTAENKGSEALSILNDMLAKGVKSAEIFLLSSVIHGRKKDLKAAEASLKSGIEANPKSIPLHLNLVNLLIASNRSGEAIAELNKLIELEPDNIGHKVMLAGVYWDAGQEARGREVLSGLVSADPENEAKWISAAQFFILKNRLPDAEAQLKKGIEQNGKSLKIRYALGELYTNTNRLDSAISILKESLTLKTGGREPQVVLAKNALAKIYFSMNEIDTAEAYTDEVIKDNPKNVDAHFLKGRIYLLKGNGVNAVPEFRTVITEQPQFIPGYLSLAEAHVWNKEYSVALDTLQTALKIDPKSKAVLLAIPRTYAMQREYKKAEDYLLKAIKAAPRDNDLKAELGDLYAAQKNFHSAEREYMEIKAKEPGSIRGCTKLAQLYLNEGKLDKAVKELESGYKAHPRSSELVSSLTKLYLAQKKPAKAVSLCEGWTSKNPRDFLILNILGEVYAYQKDMQKAEATFRKAIEMQPLWPIPHNNLAGVYLAQGKKAEAIKGLEDALKASPNNMAAYISLAQIHYKSKDFQNARLVYERALEKQPKLWIAANDLAFIMCEYPRDSRDLDTAFDLANKALKLQPEEPSVADTLGWIYYKKGETKKGLDFVEKALSKIPENPAICYHMGALLLKSGRSSEAREYLAKALSSNADFPGREEAKKLLERT